VDKDECFELFDYNDWANERIFAALDNLGEDEWAVQRGGSFGSIRGTAAHLVAAEALWLRRWQGHTPTEVPPWVEAPTRAELQVELEAVAVERQAWLGGVSESDLARDLHYRFLSGAEHDTRLALLLRHLVNHSTYHRGQLAAFLRDCGRDPPSTDWVVWDFQRRGE